MRLADQNIVDLYDHVFWDIVCLYSSIHVCNCNNILVKDVREDHVFWVNNLPVNFELIQNEDAMLVSRL